MINRGSRISSICLKETIIGSDYDNSFESLPETAKRIIDTFLSFYLIGDDPSSYKDSTIKIDFPIDSVSMDWFRSLYDFRKIPFPKIQCELENFKPLSKSTSDKKVRLLAFSGGKDSSYLAINENVLPVHLIGLNNQSQERELKAVQQLSKLIQNDPIFVQIENNSTIQGDTGYQVRDGLIYVVIAAIGLRFGTSEIISGSYIEDDWYCESELGISGINSMLDIKNFQSYVKVIEHMSEEEVIKSLIKLNPQILSITSSCVISEPDFSSFRRLYNTEFDDPELLPNSCGLCGKCAQINLSRMLFDSTIIMTDFESRQKLVSYYVSRYVKSNPFKSLVEYDLLRKATIKYNCPLP